MTDTNTTARQFGEAAKLMADAYLEVLAQREPGDAERLALLVNGGWRIVVSFIYGPSCDPLIEFRIRSDEAGEERLLASLPLHRRAPADG